MIGANSNEASVLAAFGTDANRLFGTLGGQTAASLRTLYPGAASDTQLAQQAFGDATFVAGARFVARSVAAHAQPVYLYHFDYVAEKRRGKVPGAGHGSEIPYVFDSTDKLPSIVRTFVTTADSAMARALNRYWINFATTGDPNGSGLPHWPKYAADTDELLLIRPKIEAVAHFRAPQLDSFQQRWEGAEARQRLGAATRRHRAKWVRRAAWPAPSPLLRAGISRSSSPPRPSRRP
jgi:para-nitrobenzyl esterase